MVPRQAQTATPIPTARAHNVTRRDDAAATSHHTTESALSKSSTEWSELDTEAEQVRD